MTAVRTARTNGAAQRATVAPTTTTKSRRPARAAIGAVLVVVFALVGALALAGVDHRRPVLVVTRQVEAGQPVAAADVGVARVAGNGLATLPASAEASVVGRVAATRLLPGMAVVRAELGDARPPDPTKVELPLTLKAGEFPPGLRVGDRVLVVATVADGVAATAVAPGSGPVPATVTGLDDTRLAGVASTTTVSVLVPRTSLQTLANAASNGRVLLARELSR
jgi:hypothetical protein